MADPIRWPAGVPRPVAPGQSAQQTIGSGVRVEMDIGTPRMIARHDGSMSTMTFEARMTGAQAETWLAWWESTNYGADDVLLPLAGEHDGPEAWWVSRIATQKWRADNGNRWTLSLTALLRSQIDGGAPWVSTGAVAEDGVQTASGTLPAPLAGTAVIAAAGATRYGAWTVNSAGAWTYSLANSSAAVQGLVSGQTARDVIQVATTGGQRGEIRIDISGADDAAGAAAGDTTGAVQEDRKLFASGRLVFPDADAGQSGPAVAHDIQGLYGVLRVDSTGWGYALDNRSRAVQHLDDTQTLTDVFTVASADGSAATTVTITISGVYEVDDFVELRISGDGATGSVQVTDGSQYSHTTASVVGVTVDGANPIHGTGALKCTSTTGNVLFGPAPEFGLPAEFTLSAWVYRPADQGAAYLLAASATRYCLLQAGVFSAVGWGTGTALSTMIPLATWTHVAITCDNTGTVRLFRDGQVAQTASGTAAAPASEPFGLFGIPGRADLTSFVGSLDDIVWSPGICLHNATFVP